MVGGVVDPNSWFIYGVPAVVLVLGLLILARWISDVAKRVFDHAERISHLEGRITERDTKEPPDQSGQGVM